MRPQNQSTNVIVIRALVDAVLEGDEHFSVRLFPAESAAVIDPLNGECVSCVALLLGHDNFALLLGVIGKKPTHYNIIHSHLVFLFVLHVLPQALLLLASELIKLPWAS